MLENLTMAQEENKEWLDWIIREITEYIDERQSLLSKRIEDKFAKEIDWLHFTDKTLHVNADLNGSELDLMTLVSKCRDLTKVMQSNNQVLSNQSFNSQSLADC